MIDEHVHLWDFNRIEEPGSGDVADVRPLAELLDALEEYVRAYVVVSDAQAAAVTLWTAHTHVLEATDVTPYLHVTSAEAESGKSRLLEVLELLVPRPLTTAGSVTVAVMFRVIDQMSPTLLLDEADNVFADKSLTAALLGVINAGWRRGQRVYRMGGAQHNRLDAFEVFCAKAICGLDRKLAPTLASRCLRIEMRRRLPEETIRELFLEEARPEAESIRDDLAAWSAMAVDDLRRTRPRRLGVRDRLEEGLRLLLAIADAAGGDWPQRARAALRELAGVSTANANTHGIELLRDLRGVFGEREELATVELLNGLFAIEESPWASWWADGRADGDPQPSRAAAMKLARMLRPFGISSSDIGASSARHKGYRRADFAETFARYLPPEVAQVAHTAQPRQEQALEGRAHSTRGSDLDEAASPHEHSVCATCATSKAHDRARVQIWLARDGRWRCARHEPPAFPGEVVDRKALAIA